MNFFRASRLSPLLFPSQNSQEKQTTIPSAVAAGEKPSLEHSTDTWTSMVTCLLLANSGLCTCLVPSWIRKVQREHFFVAVKKIWTLYWNGYPIEESIFPLVKKQNKTKKHKVIFYWDPFERLLPTNVFNKLCLTKMWANFVLLLYFNFALTFITLLLVFFKNKF